MVLNQLGCRGSPSTDLGPASFLVLSESVRESSGIAGVKLAWRSCVRGHCGSHAITAQQLVHVSRSQEVRRCSLLATALSYFSYAVTGHLFLGRR